MENDYPGFKEFFECFNKLKNKLKIKYLSYSGIISDNLSYLDSDSDDDDGVDRDDIVGILDGCEDSESDSDSD